jgi:uncharacterized protein
VIKIWYNAHMNDTEFINHLNQATVSALYYYPIKSCAGIAVQSWKIVETGFLHDREFMLIDSKQRFMTQREFSRMSLILPSVDDERLKVNAPEMPELSLKIVKDGERLSSTIWKDTVEVIDQGDEAAQWFSKFLDTQCRLVRKAESYKRQVNQTYAPRESDQVSFADGYPFLLISAESIEDLNSILDDPLPINRFRPNIVIIGGRIAFAEDRIKTLKIGNITFDGVKPCIRCAIPTINQKTAERGSEPTKTLSTFRKGEYKPGKSGIIFGQNLIHRENGSIKIEDPVTIIELKEPPTFLLDK